MNATIISLIRTGVAVAVGWVLTLLASKLGFVIDPASQVQLVAAFTAIATAAYYGLVRLAESRYPQFGWLLGIAKAPAYPLTPAKPSPR